MNLTNKQYIAISMAVLAFLAASTGQMTEFLGPQAAKAVASGASFINGILAAIMSVILGQASLVKDVQAMPGVEKITVNAAANSALAKEAVNPDNDKIEATPEAAAAVQHTARNS